ncbi:flagellar motor protein MotB [Niastella yeongjuensis]|uniref:Flagellar motor protein MotB n=1 Tax=Niastella yeongjuensis TaxID=354355 RepID=A0A1V9E1R0_9BACT|nr:OmpA family protein [Niastella yeongjuensis]OQP40063.1 flagellar motor protein MotB [Niastella yeongjuensis]SEO15511.1 chemotaxis protein MotB [Niastella yeongjuensis]
MNRIVTVTKISIGTLIFLSSCVPTKKFKASQAALQSARNDSAVLAQHVSQLKQQVADLQASVESKNKSISDLDQEIDKLSKDISDLNQEKVKLINDASSKQSQLTKSGQELVSQKKKLEQLQALMDQQKQAIEEIRKKMAAALNGFKSSELTVATKNGKVYVSLQENLLFPSGSAVVNPKGKEALHKLADVLNINPDITVDIEGHTDSIPIRGKYQDNWDLSLARAASIVRILTTDYKVTPERVVASGHSQFEPIQTNSTAEGRAQNRRTDIILSPKLDELYKLLQNPTASTASK